MSFLDILTGKESEQENKQGVLSGKRIAFLATNGFEQSELFDPKSILEDAGATVKIISLHAGSIKGWNEKNWGKKIDVDITIDLADSEEFDGLVLPGGVMNPDTLRQDARAVGFVRGFVEAGKPIGAICHGPQILIEVDASFKLRSPGAIGLNTSMLSDDHAVVSYLKGHTMTSYPSLKTDLLNAGAHWVDREVVSDNGLITSRKPADIPAFAAKLIEAFAQEIGSFSSDEAGKSVGYGYDDETSYVASGQITDGRSERVDSESPLSDSYMADTRVNDQDSDKLNSSGPTSAQSDSLRRPRPTYPQAPNSRL